MIRTFLGGGLDRFPFCCLVFDQLLSIFVVLLTKSNSEHRSRTDTHSPSQRFKGILNLNQTHWIVKLGPNIVDQRYVRGKLYIDSIEVKVLTTFIAPKGLFV